MMLDFACRRFDLREVVKCGLGLSKADFNILEELMGDPARWHTTSELAGSTALDVTTVQRAVKKLHSAGAILRSQENLSGGGYVFRYRAKDKPELRKLIIAIVRKWAAKVEEELGSW